MRKGIARELLTRRVSSEEPADVSVKKYANRFEPHAGSAPSTRDFSPSLTTGRDSHAFARSRKYLVVSVRKRASELVCDVQACAHTRTYAHTHTALQMAAAAAAEVVVVDGGGRNEGGKNRSAQWCQ